MGMINRLFHGFDRLLGFFAPLADLAVRIFLADVFFKAGLTKIQSWQSTLALFTHEYKVPIVSPAIAAYSGTFVELVFPILLLVGVLGRFPAFVLFIFNIIAVISYPFLMTDAGQVGLYHHMFLGALLLMCMTHGPGKLSLDELFRSEKKPVAKPKAGSESKSS